MGKLSYSKMKGTKNHCTCAQVWDKEGNNLAIIDSRLGEEKASYYAMLFSEGPKLLSLLRDLSDLQNGPPLETIREEWQSTMDEAYELLGRLESPSEEIFVKYQELFNHMSKEHNLTLLESEMEEIVELVKNIY
jgi:hypothetical protein